MDTPGEMPISDERDARCEEAECPRCGYALGGAIAAWTEVCPLDGTCSECGLVFEWARVLRSDLFPPPWSFEHAKKGRLGGTAIRTLLLVLWPKRFWSNLRMTDRIRPRRLALLVALWLAAPVLALYLLSIAGNVLLWWDIQRGQVRIWNVAPLPPGGGTVLEPKDVQLLWPMIVSGVLDPLEQSRILYVHSSIGPVPAYLRDGAGHLLVALSALIGQQFAWHWNAQEILVLLILWSAIITVLPISFGLLPVSRGRRGIRTVHLLRIWCYSFILTAWYVLLSVPLALFGGVVMSATGVAAIGGTISPLPIFFFLPLLWFWWIRAIGRHLKLPRPWLVAGLLLLVSGLFVLLVALVIVNLRW